MKDEGFYMVRADKKSWTKDKVTIAEIETKGFKVQPSRLNGDYTVFSSDGLSNLASLFSTEKAASEYLFC